MSSQGAASGLSYFSVIYIRKVHPYPVKSIYLNFQPIEVVSRYRDPQPQVIEKLLRILNFV